MKILFIILAVSTLIVNSLAQISVEPLGVYYNYAIWDAKVDSSVLYIACGEKGILSVDISNPSAPILLDELDTPGFARDLEIAGNLIYIADLEYSGLIIIDKSSPETLSIIGTCHTGGGAFDAAVQGSFVYIADGKMGLCVIDAADSSQPYIIGRCENIGDAQGVAVEGQYAYISTYQQGLRIIDISDPASPFETGYCELLMADNYYPGLARKVIIRDTLAYIADYGCGLRIIDISDKQNPEIISTSYQNIGNAYSVALWGNYAFLAAEFGGIKIMNISNPSAPFLCGNYSTSVAVGITISGETIFLSCLDKLMIFNIMEGNGR